METLQELEDHEDWQEAERAWITKMKKRGHDLTNITEGGEGGATYGRLGILWTDEQRKNYSTTRKGMSIAVPSPELLKKRGKAIKEHWRLIRLAGGKKKGPVHTPETKARLSEAHTGKVLTNNHKKKLSFAKFARGWSTKRQLLAFKKGAIDV